jgi:hypothetical protein
MRFLHVRAICTLLVPICSAVVVYETISYKSPHLLL